MNTADGELLYQIVRQDRPGGKTFSVRRPDGRGGWILGLGTVEPVLYRLPELLHRSPGSLVYVLEGERKVDRLVGLGLCATCSPFGAGSWRLRYSLALSDADVVVLPDLDEPGERHAQAVALSVSDVAASVCLVHLPGLHRPGDDVLDWLDRDGHPVEELLGLVGARPAVDAGHRAGEDRGTSSPASCSLLARAAPAGRHRARAGAAGADPRRPRSCRPALLAAGPRAPDAVCLARAGRASEPRRERDEEPLRLPRLRAGR